MVRVLLTSFEPFGDRAENSSLEVGRAVAASPPPGVDLEWLILPVVAGECAREARSAIEQWEPRLVLSLGQSAGTSAVRVERQATNLDDFAAPDNAGNQRRRLPVAPNGPTYHVATVGVDHLVRELRRRGISAEPSASAGAFVCNHLFYELLHPTLSEPHAYRAGFLHLPLAHGQVRRSESTSSLALDELAEGVRLAIAACLTSPARVAHTSSSAS
jgi:pyroglutamyl-peptidase